VQEEETQAEKIVSFIGGDRNQRAEEQGQRSYPKEEA
jgi:hypothetical protein